MPGTMGRAWRSRLPCREGRLEGDQANQPQDLLIHRAGGKQLCCPSATPLCPASLEHRDWEPLREQLEEDGRREGSEDPGNNSSPRAIWRFLTRHKESGELWWPLGAMQCLRGPRAKVQLHCPRQEWDRRDLQRAPKMPLT